MRGCRQTALEITVAKMRHDKAKQREQIKKFGYEPPVGRAVPGQLSPPPPGTENPDPSMRPQLFSSLPELWKSVTDRIKARRAYSMRERYFPSEIISHSSFGDGIIFEVSPENVSVLFQEGIKKLAHRKPPKEASPKPEDVYEGVYHSKLGQLLLFVEESGGDGLYVFVDMEGKTRRFPPDDIGPLETKGASHFSEKQRHAYSAYLDHDEAKAGRLRSAEQKANEYLKNPAVLKILAHWGSINELLTGELRFLYQTAEEMIAGTVSPHASTRAKRLLVQAVLGGFDPDSVPPPWATKS